MRHVANGIIDLSLVERPPSPIREACALIKADRQIGVYKIGITDLFALAQRHCRDLGVEHGMGRLAREIMDNLDILSSGMKNLQHILIIGEQIKQRRKVKARRLGIDGGRFLVVVNLHQASIRPDRTSTRLNSSLYCASRMPSSAC